MTPWPTTLQRSRIFRRSRAGLSLIELLLGLAIGTLVFLAIAAATTAMSRSITVNKGLLLDQQSARLALQIMGQAIRQCSSCQLKTVVSGSVSDGSNASGSEFQFTGPSSLVVQSFKYDSTAKQLQYIPDNSSPPSPVPVFARAITSCTFTLTYDTDSGGHLYVRAVRIDLGIAQNGQALSISSSTVPRQILPVH